MSGPEHAPQGDPCARPGCGLSEADHRKPRAPRPNRPKNLPRDVRTKRKRRETDQARRALAREKRNQEPIVAIDGEGKGRDPHLYTYLAAVDEHGDKRGSVSNPEGLETIHCLNFLLDLGVSRVFGFSLGYDFSMMLKDLPDEALYLLVRPEKRSRVLPEGRTVHRPVYWRGFKLTYMRRRLGIWRVAWNAEKRQNVPVGKGVIVWDVFAFYQGKFTKALSDWKTTTSIIIDEIAAMKNRRSDFDKMNQPAIEKYCDTECHLLGKLVRQLIESHETAGLPLTSFYGAGSTASALLHRMGVKDYIAEPPAEMSDSVSRAFFGGRFELSLVGSSCVPCWNHDISSAYPYELWRLPCLTHGCWRLVTGSEKHLDREIRKARLALVHSQVKRSGPLSWGPLPFRVPRARSLPAEKDFGAGTILFPMKSEGSWCWQDEYLAARDTLWPGVIPRDAWCYHTDCDCRPFAELPEIYKERIRIGKDGAGIVLKLGPNSCYGKTAQSVGSAPFRSWIWAGCVTSGTRAQILRAIAAASNPDNVLMVATDGVLATERLCLPKPEDTGTWSLPDENGRPVRKPLGGWEVTDDADATQQFLARPGIYWPLRPTEEDLRKIKARGISKSVLAERAQHIEQHFKRKGWHVPYPVDGRCIRCDVPTPHRTVHGCRQYRSTCPKCGGAPAPPCVRFVGARQGLTINAEGKRLLAQGQRITGEHVTRSDDFSEWVEWPLEINFHPAPKRVTVRRDRTLETWDRYPGGGESAPYNRAFGGVDALTIQQFQEMSEEQPDGDLTLD